MSTTHFKLSQEGGVIRRLTFASRPTWSSFAEKVAGLTGIPAEHIGASYLDSDGDEVTLSSDLELQDYYKYTLLQPSQPIKFSVKDLRDRPKSAKSQASPQIPQANILRNTFGGFEVEDDWQIPGLVMMSRPGNFSVGDMLDQGTSHGFIEVVDSDVSSISNGGSEVGSNRDSDDSGTVMGGGFMESMDKGKGRDMDVSSTGSVLAEDVNPKHPVHVYDMSVHEDEVISTALPTAGSVKDQPTQSAPKAPIQSINTPVEPPVAVEEVEDPPLPSLDSQSSAPSLTNDIADLLTNLTGVMSAHPELSEGLRNIVRNASNGTYWSAHRDAISRAAEDIARTAQEETGKAAADLRRTAEEEAGKRVAEALGGIFKVFSDLTGVNANITVDVPPAAPAVAPEPAAAETVKATETATRDGSEPNFPPWRGGGRHSWWGRPNPSGPPPPQFPWGPHPHHGPPPRHGPPGGPHHHGPPNPHHGPFPFHHGPPPPTPPFWPPAPSAGPPPPPPPPPFGHPGLRPHIPASYLPPGFVEGFAPAQAHGFSASVTPAEVNAAIDARSQVEAAKALYKAEKEKYRAEREERRQERQRKMRAANTATAAGSSVAPKADDTEASTTAPAPTTTEEDTSINTQMTQVVSLPRRRFPQLEMVSVPRRYNTYSGPPPTNRVHTSVRDAFPAPLTRAPPPPRSETTTRSISGEAPESRTIRRISRRLADMGFTETAYPMIPEKAKTHMPANGFMSKDAEDDVVTTMLEELLSMSPVSPMPVASGSGLNRGMEIPGSYHP